MNVVSLNWHSVSQINGTRCYVHKHSKKIQQGVTWLEGAIILERLVFSVMFHYEQMKHLYNFLTFGESILYLPS